MYHQRAVYYAYADGDNRCIFPTQQQHSNCYILQTGYTYSKLVRLPKPTVEVVYVSCENHSARLRQHDNNRRQMPAASLSPYTPASSPSIAAYNPRSLLVDASLRQRADDPLRVLHSQSRHTLRWPVEKKVVKHPPRMIAQFVFS